MKASIASAALAIFLATLGSDSAMAAKPRVAPWRLSCTEFASSNDFVKNSSLYCLNKGNSRSCHQEARQRFAECGFDGDYDRLSQRLHAKMLVFIALAGTRSSMEDTGRDAL